MHSLRKIRPAMLLVIGITTTFFDGGPACQAQQLLPDIVPWVREDAPYLVNWDITNGRLRMQTMFANIGDGLLQIRTDSAGTGGATTNVTQRIFSNVDNGPVFTDYFVNTALNFHGAHGHIHFEDFSEFQLLEAVIEPSGMVTVGDLVANEVKTSYRIHDTARIPDPMYASNISYPSSNTGLFQNISVGHGDIYSHGTEGQSISLAGVPVGPWYWLRQIVDPTNVLREKNDANNSFEILIDLNQPGKAIRQLSGSFVRPGDLAPPLPGDLNGDRLINLQDWIAFKATASSSLVGVDDHTALTLGDLNLDRQHSISDTLLFRQYYEVAQGAGSFAEVLQIPEPSTLMLGGVALMLLAAGRRATRPGRRAKWLAAALLAVACCPMPQPAFARVTLFLEDFEGLPLGSNVDETLANPEAWTETPPAGWTVDDSGVPFVASATRGVTEWKGWSFADKAWWASAAGDQGRSQFALGEGTVAVADPDEWDDKGTPVSGTPFGGYYNALMKTPAIPLDGAAPNTAKLAFASSWLPECCDDGPSDTNRQTARIRVSYNGGANFTQVLRWESSPASGFYKDDAPNETVILDLNNPDDASSVVLEIGLLDAGNDWWWAIDNVEIFTPTVLEVDLSTGMMSIAGAVGLTGYEITSSAGSLSHVGWEAGNLDAQNFGPASPLSADFNNDNSVDAADYVLWRDALGTDDRGDATGDGQTDPLDYGEWRKQFGQSLAEGQSWETLISTDEHLMEFFLLGSSTFAAQAVGAGYDTTVDARDLSFKYSTADGLELTGIVRYVAGAAASLSLIPEPATWSPFLASMMMLFPRQRATAA